MHLPRGIAGAGCGAGANAAIDIFEIVGRKPELRGAHILLQMPARFRTGNRHNDDAGARALRNRPGDGELRKRGVVPAFTASWDYVLWLNAMPGKGN